jgi:hypothetical protein
VTPEEIARHSLKRGAEYPYDSSVDTSVEKPTPATDWAHAAARGILYDLNDRSGIKQAFRGVDPEIRVEIVASMAEIIRQAKSAP